jgi:DNA polymerase-3 subunit epsilon
MDAPTFEEISSPLEKALRGGVLVAHNATFDINFLKAEFRRAGIDWAPDQDSIFDTMVLAKWVLGEGQSLKLADLCERFDISNERAHSALDDAIATAKLLDKLVESNASLGDMLKISLLARESSVAGVGALSELGKDRNSITCDVPHKGFIPALVAALPLTGSLAPNSLEYLANLHKAFEDFVLTNDEMYALTSLAADLDLSLADVSSAHSQFFQDLASRAWRDGVLTDDEWSQLRYVGETIGTSPIELEIAKTGRGFRSEVSESSLPLGLNKGDCVVLTGDMVPTKSEVSQLLVSAGLEIKSSISKKVRLLIAADADSLSGKAAAARKLGITVISTEMFVAQWA